MEPRLGFPLLFLLFSICFKAESKCNKGCDLALASYYVWISSIDYVETTTRVNVPFPCDCIGSEFLGYVFKYPIHVGDNYVEVANQSYSNLTTASSLQSLNSYQLNNFPNSGTLNVTVNCSCGDSHQREWCGLYPRERSKRYGYCWSVCCWGHSWGSVVNSLSLSCVLPKEGARGKLLSEVAVYSAQSGNDSNGSSAAVDTSIKGITVDKSLRGEKAAIKKMESQKSREFLAELKVFTRVYHLNLVHLIGYCVKKDSLFLVYEYIDKGNLSQHLRDSGREPLSWSIQVQIALDSARGLEYIHEHTVPVYIHRDIKSANVLIDRNFHAKVADFGLTKLTEVGSSAHPIDNLAGTSGYMAPEYAYGSFSPKIDVFTFGVVLYELISAKEALLRAGESGSDKKGLVSLFEEALEKPNP
ncbi:hypothetical protein K1719_026446 [Acacia pycnantha]|nr:hypothetical protein K1719_026446 [Acacia pycnantha]